MLGRGGLREEHGGAIRDERCLWKEAWWRRKTMLKENIKREQMLWLRNKDEERKKKERKEESRSEEKSRRDRIKIRCKARVKERKKVKAKMTHKLK